jgi:hypothetical protein
VNRDARSLGPDAWHLPHLDPTWPRRRAIGATALQVPVPSPAQVATQWEGLERAASAWRQQSAGERVRRIAAASQALRQAGPGDWTDLLARSSGLSHAGLAAAWDVTFAPCDTANLEAAVAAEPDAVASGGARIVHVLAGNVLPPTWTMLVRGFLVGAPQWLRPAEREPLFAPCVAAHLATIDPELARTFAVLWWPHDDPDVEPEVLRAAQVVTCQGDDASVAAVGARVAALAPQARVVGYGTRWSAALITRGAQQAASAAAVAHDVAHDIALFDGHGCLSPVVVFAEDGPALEPWCAALAEALAAIEARVPRGTIAPEGRAALRVWRDVQRLGRALGTVREVWESAGSTAWAVVLQHNCEWPQPPSDRHLVVLPFERLQDVTVALGARAERLQGLAVAWDDWGVARRDAWLAALAPTRVAPAGTLQQAPPGWRQDHRPALASLVVGELSRP